ncbi:Thioredoxin-like fold [Cynara cardunculus var. scolymus]|uniref:Thioredoxin-like fold n=1 Tax=Cynara cardunculus var. scolymus TaxID=59895 RepID=A0A124SH87_CYNCS|nr:Thioredoxin-like fold [Cynara cardunculus var. scolymus]
MATFFNLSSPPSMVFSHGKLRSCHPPFSFAFPFATELKSDRGWGNGRLVSLQVKCLNDPTRDATESEPTSLSSGSSTSTGISSYSWCAGLGGLGFLETGYLTYSKLTGSDAFCPIGGGSCGDILNSNYAVVFGTLFVYIPIFLVLKTTNSFDLGSSYSLFYFSKNDSGSLGRIVLVGSRSIAATEVKGMELLQTSIPLPLIGMVAYGVVAALALKLAAKDLPSGIDESNGGLILLGTTTSMATASAYFLYILSTQFPGASCSYCLASVLLSFSLFFTTAKILGWQKIREELGLQLCISGLVLAALSNSYSASSLPPARFGDKFLPFSPTEIKAPSSPLAIKLAAHLRSIGAKMYGAFWCSHCLEQKQMFGREAAKLLDYVECFPDGYKTGTELGKECSKIKIEGFPMWVINGKVLKGYQEFPDLAKESGFEAGEFSQELAELAKQSAEANSQPS